MITDAARTAEDCTQVRQLQLQAAQCLDEALKFYDPDNDVPPPEAFFSEDSQRHFRERPDLFSRQRLIELRAKLPWQKKRKKE